MKFKDFTLLQRAEVPEGYFGGLQGDGFVVVGKVRPWDPDDKEYVLYSDGDLILATLQEEA